MFGSCLAAALFAALLTGTVFTAIRPCRCAAAQSNQQLAEGSTARVGEGLTHRKDEVSDLGRDVDRMGNASESLVGAHQRLIRDVSHELRSPLARLNVALELAANRQARDTQPRLTGSSGNPTG